MCAVFSNGTAAMFYYEGHCVKCLHQGGCEVWALHKDYAADESKVAILNRLIPEPGMNGNTWGTCRMYLGISEMPPNLKMEIHGRDGETNEIQVIQHPKEPDDPEPCEKSIHRRT